MFITKTQDTVIGQKQRNHYLYYKSKCEVIPQKEEWRNSSIFSCSKRDILIVQFLLERTDVDPNEKNQVGETPLSAAILNSDIEIVQSLLERKDVDPNEKNENGETPLYLAVQNKDIEIVQSLLESTDVDPNETNKNWETALHSAARSCNYQIVRLLLERTDVVPNLEDMEKKTPLDLSDEQTWFSEEDVTRSTAIKQLIKKKIEENSKMSEMKNFETELRGLGLETTEDLKEVMKLGYFKCFWNRVYIVGPYFSGKSCLAKLLVGDALPKERKSTDGIWIYMGRAGMDLNDGKWIFIPKGEVVQEILMSMIMTLSKTESLDTENQTASLDEPEKNIIRRPVSIKNDHEEVVIFENSPQGFVHKEIISQVHRRESLGAHDNTFTACISEENSNICDTANETKMLNVISADIRTPVVPSKNELDGQNAKKRTPLERISKTHIVPDTESNALGIFVAAPNTPRLFPEESKISDVEELESSPSEIFLKEISTSEFRLVESIAEYPKIDGKKTTNPVREKYKEKLIKEVANELSHNKLHEMVISSIREGKYKQSIVPIDIWDFGGQKDYYMTHQLFITSRGIFVLVFNGSLNLHKHMPDLSFLPGHLGKPTIAVYLLHWVNSILTYCKRSEDGFPRIVFVATHKDKIRKNVDKHRQKLMKVIQDIFESHAGLKHLEFNPLIFVNSTNEADPEIQALRQRLMDRAKEHPRWGEHMPTAWVPLELHLAQQAEKGITILTKDQIKMFNSQNESMVLTEKQLETFLKVQHSLGKLLYFDLANLRDSVIITPAYLVDVLRSIITEKQFWPKGKRLRNIFHTMQRKGAVSRADMYDLWKQPIFEHILSYKDFIIEVLVHLDILVAERNNTEDLGTPIRDVTQFLVPSMITRPDDTKYMKKCYKSGTSILLSYKFIEKVIPPAFPYRFIASFVDMWGVKNYKNKKRMLFSNLAVVEVDDNHDVAVQVIENRVVVSLIHAETKEHIVPTIATSVQEFLTAAVHRISEFYSTLSADSFTTDQRSELHSVIPFEIEFGVHCKKKSCFFNHDKIPTTANWRCPEHKINHDVRCLKLWFSEKMPREKCDESCKGLGRLEMEQSPSSKHLRRLASNLEIKDCRELLIRLGLDTKVLNDVQEKFAPSAYHENDFKYTAMLRWEESVTNSSFKIIHDAFAEIDKHLLCEVFRDVNVDDVLERFSIPADRANKIPSNTILQELSNHVGNSGKQLGIELGLESAKIEEIQNDHSYKLLHQNKEILRVWSQTKFPKPTVKELIKALQRIGKIGCLRKISF